MIEFTELQKTELRLERTAKKHLIWTYEEYWNTYYPQLPDGGVIATLWDKLPIVIVQTKPKYDSEADTLKHIKRVNELLLDCSKELMNRAQVHDDSKLKDPEKALFDLWTPLLKGSTYGSPEYKKMLEGLKPSLEHHYKNNSHHPEFVYSKEIWKDIENYEGRYEISNLGRVKTKDKFRKCHVTPKGYNRIQLYNGETNKNFFVHTLVANAFLKPSFIPNKQVNHKDGNKLNNSYLNLEWVTPSDNLQHAYDNDLRPDTYKYIVHCNELDITTFGTHKMERELLKLGYEKASAASIWRCINSDNETNTHLNLTFKTFNINEYHELNSPINGMDLFDIMEMLMDWKAATERHTDGDIFKSIEINKDRFKMSEQLCQIYRNTVLNMQWKNFCDDPELIKRIETARTKK